MFGDMFGGFNGRKLKSELKMAVSRFQIASNKKSAIMKQNMREVAVLLAEEPPKEEKARIRAEALIRDDNLIEAYDILQLECELLGERIKLLEQSKGCPPDLLSTISDLIYACARVDIPELGAIRKQFRAKYGKEFEQNAMNNKGNILNERIVTKLSVHPPAAYLVQTYLEKIAEQFEVDWQPTIKLSTEQMIEPMAAPIGYSVQSAQGTGLGPGAQAQWTTGTQNTDEEINYQKNGGQRNDIPPPAPGWAASPPTVSATPYEPSGSGKSNNLPTVQPYVPGSGVSTTSSMTYTHQNGGGKTETDNSAYEEVDIFVPQIPSAPPGSASPKSGKKQDDYDDEDDGDEQKFSSNDDATSPSGGTSTYADLAARFEQLNK